MAIELHLSKPDVTTHWGFRLVGGADFHEPLVVVKVNENSLAENAGLMVGDVVVRVNNTSTAGLPHAVAHDLINSAGCDFIMAIRRGMFTDMPASASEEETNSEIEGILEKSQDACPTASEKDQGVGDSPAILENLAGQEQLVENAKAAGNKPKRWSTFLVKPKHSKPVPKKQLEEKRKIIGEPYKVKIIKQPRRDPLDVLNHKKSVKFEPNVVEVEISRESSVEPSVDSLEFADEMEIEASVQITEETTVEICEAEDEDDQDENGNITENGLVEEAMENEPTLTKPVCKPLDIHLEPIVCESSLSLEEQLAAVQKQLLTLSQLPSAIQVTLEAVTQQLNKIVSEKSAQPHEKCEETAENAEKEIINTEPEDEANSESENAEADITENDDEGNVDELEEDAFADEEQRQDADDVVEVESQNQEEDVEEELDPYAGLTDEEKEARIREEQLMAKKQKINHWNRIWPWSNKEKPVYSINFLKYQPPPKNLDYLQKSEVYRLIHDMEPPVKGIGARAEKILSEKDYYREKGAP